MLRLLADENFNGDIVRALMLRRATLDIVRVQDVGLEGRDDPLRTGVGRRERPNPRDARSGDDAGLLVRSRRGRPTDAGNVRPERPNPHP
jgi:hypothetical protein